MDALIGRNVDDRYFGGFDRWKFASLAHRQISCQMSPYFIHAEAENNLAWWWDAELEIWNCVGASDQMPICVDNFVFLAMAQHAIPLIYTFSFSPVSSERDNAYECLERATSVLSDRWKRDGNEANYRHSVAGFYREVTDSYRWQVEVFSPPNFSQSVHDELSRLDWNIFRVGQAARIQQAFGGAATLPAT